MRCPTIGVNRYFLFDLPAICSRSMTGFQKRLKTGFGIISE
jgi:hypothetical protein